MDIITNFYDPEDAEEVVEWLACYQEEAPESFKAFIEYCSKANLAEDRDRYKWGEQVARSNDDQKEADYKATGN